VSANAVSSSILLGGVVYRSEIINDERFPRDDLALHTSLAHDDAAERFPNFRRYTRREET